MFYVILVTSGIKRSKSWKAYICQGIHHSPFTNCNHQMKKDKEEALLKKREEAERKVQILANWYNHVTENEDGIDGDDGDRGGCDIDGGGSRQGEEKSTQLTSSPSILSVR